MINCDYCGKDVEDREIYVIPDERAVCRQCAMAWDAATKRFTAARVTEINEIFEEIRDAQ